MVCLRDILSTLLFRVKLFWFGERWTEYRNKEAEVLWYNWSHTGYARKCLCWLCSPPWLSLILVDSIDVEGCPHRCYAWSFLDSGQHYSCSLYPQAPLPIGEVKSFLSSAPPFSGLVSHHRIHENH